MNVKKLASPLVIFLVIIICSLAFYMILFSTRKNDMYDNGNSSGNLYNNGLFCEYNDQIYFSHPRDNGALYVMNSDLSNPKKLHSDKVYHLNVSGSYIIYSKRNNLKEDSTFTFGSLNSVGIYRTSLSGKRSLLLDQTAVGTVHQYGNYVYYQHYDKDQGYSFYQVGIDGRNKIKIDSMAINTAAIENNYMYYTGQSNPLHIYRRNLGTMEEELVKEGAFMQVLTHNNKLYYISVNDHYSIMRSNLDGSDVETLVTERCITYNISPDGVYLYYQVDGTNQNHFGRLNLLTMEHLLLLEGNYRNINVTKDYVFVQTFADTATYMLSHGEGRSIALFDPSMEQ